MKELKVVHHELDLSFAGGKDCPIELVRAVPTPEPLDRWFPIPHATLVDCFKEQMQTTGLNIVQEYFTLARDGQRFFALFQVEGIASPHASEIGTVIGLRNSHDKSFRAAICAGCAPFVCTNLAFSNEIVLGRRHTTNIMADLPQVISRAIGKLSDHWAANDKRIDAYKAFELDTEQADHLIIEMFLHGAITKTHIGEVANQWRKPDHEEFSARNGWSLYNAATNVLRGNLVALNNRSDALHGLLDPMFGVLDV